MHDFENFDHPLKSHWMIL